MHTAPGVCLLYAPGAVCFTNMVLEHIYLTIFFKIINGPEPYGPGAYGPGPYGQYCHCKTSIELEPITMITVMMVCTISSWQ